MKPPNRTTSNYAAAALLHEKAACAKPRTLFSPVANRRKGSRIGFTLIELLIVIGIVAVLMGLLLAVMNKAQSSAHKIHCLSNLRQITMSFHLYAGENHGKFPDPAISDLPWEATLSRFLTDPKVFLCNADSELGPTNGSSYDWRDTGDPASTLAGKKITDAQWNVIVVFEALPGWHQRCRMNVSRLDGSCEEMDDQKAIKEIQLPIHQ